MNERSEEKDESLVSRLVQKDTAAMKKLYSRYAPLVFHLAASSLDSGAAEDLVQEVFFTLWSKASEFDPRKGVFKPWFMQIVHYKILNELRRSSRRPLLDPDDGKIDSVAAETDGPMEEAWKNYKGQALREAIEKLPFKQRQALSLAFFQELSHEQVAETLGLPLGTVKTRIRLAIAKLRGGLVPLSVLLFLLTVGISYWGFGAMQHEQTNTRALSVVTSSKVKTLTMLGQPGFPGTGTCRYEEGGSLLVMSLENLSQEPPGATYQCWGLWHGTWTRLGTLQRLSNGRAFLVVDDVRLLEEPDSIQVTLEPLSNRDFPQGRKLLWVQL